MGYLPSDGVFANVRLAIPTLMLFIVLLLLPEVRLRGGSTVAARMPRLVSTSGTLVAGAALIGGAWAFAAVASDATLTDVAPGLALGLIALSMVPLTGWAGQVSLCQMTFAGMGAFAMTKVAADGSLSGCSPPSAVRCPSGRWSPSALVSRALPRCDPRVRGVHGQCLLHPQRRVQRPRVRCASSDSRCWGLLRERPRLLRAVGHVVRDVRRGLARPAPGPLRAAVVGAPRQPGACTMMGMNTTVTKLQVFALSSAIAAVGGVLLAASRARGAGDYTMFSSLPLVLLAVLGGITAVSESSIRASSSPGSRCSPRRCPASEALAPAAQDHRRHARPATRRDRALARRCGRRPWTGTPVPRGAPAAGPPRGARVVRPLRRGARPGSGPRTGDRRCLSGSTSTLRQRRRSSSCGASASTGASRCCTASTSSCLGARWWGCSDRTAPARAPPSASSPVRSGPPRVPSR